MSSTSHRVRGGSRRAALACTLVATVGLALSASASAQDLVPQNDKLYFQAETVDTAAPVKALHKVRAIAAEPQRFVLQLDGPMSPARREALIEAGVVIGSYVPANAFIVDLSGADLASVEAMGFVRFVDEFRPSWKLSPQVLAGREYTSEDRKLLDMAGRVLVNVTLFENVNVADAERKLVQMPGVEFKFTEVIGGQSVVTLEMDRAKVADLAAHSAVQFVEDAPDVDYRNSTTRWIIQTNQVNNTPVYDAGIHGEGQIIGVLDGGVDSNHCSFSDTQPIGPSHRKIVAYNNSFSTSSHGTHVAGTAAGDSGTNNDLRGIAYGAKMAVNTIPSFTESGILQRLNLHHSQGARIHTNSWGDDGTTAYNSLARGFDVFLRNNEDDVVLLAVTNGSVLRNPENAKNLIAVGATQDTPSQASHCTAGIGPTADGRRKPEIYAPGCSTISANDDTACSTTSLTGTSMACPAVAGAAALVRQYYMDGFYPSGMENSLDAFTPSGPLVKATLLNSTRDMTGIGGFPSNLEGWGRTTLDDALFFPGDSRRLVVVDDVRNADGLTTGESVDYGLNVDGSGEPLRITMAFYDVPGASGASNPVVNNVDLVAISPSGTTYRGNNFSGGQSAPNGSADAINSVEQILVNNPEQGGWTVRIVGTAVNSGTQGYAIAASGAVSDGPTALSVNLDMAAPEIIAPGSSTELTIRVNPGDDMLVGGSTKLQLSIANGSFIEIGTTQISENVFRGTIPPVDCGDDPRFFLQAEGVTTGTVFFPPAGAADPLQIGVGEFAIELMDNFETDTGWTVSNDPSLTAGGWARGLPLGGGDRSDPATDSDGSGQCFLTDPNDGDTDVDGGPTILTSPAFDFSGSLDAQISYDRYYGNSDISDTFAVEISDGGPWVTVENVNPNGASTWTTRTINVADFVSLTSTVRIRFVASDSPNNSVFEAGVDNVVASGFSCESAAACLGDCDANGVVNFEDLVAMLFVFGSDDNGMCNADQTGRVDFDDLVTALFLFGPCPK
ncbi:tagA [Symbiodinium necroappetens]|uniref:subtilisin n=1 Tax=Symbiodinium necroappetens TaxID=1628268 RepID=A0A812PKX3_9DINO|nr:tagA [Symbiodinium necroappetens]